MNYVLVRMPTGYNVYKTCNLHMKEENGEEMKIQQVKKYLFNEFIAEEYEKETDLPNNDVIQKWVVCGYVLKLEVNKPKFLYLMFMVQGG